MKRIKIAIYSGIIPSTTFIENLIRVVAHEDFDVHLFGYSTNKPKYNNARIVCHTFPNNRIYLLIIALFNFIYLRIKSKENFIKLNRYIFGKKSNFKHRLVLYAKYLPIVLTQPDIFHVQWIKGCEEWMFLNQLFGIKIIVSLRGTQINVSPLVDDSIAKTYKSIFPQIDGFHAVSDKIASLATLYGADINKIHVIYTGIDLGKINSYNKTNHSISNPLQILSVGRAHWSKGYNYAIDALRILLDEGMNFQYTIITDSLSEELLFQIEDCGFGENIKVLNSLPQEEIFKAMQRSDVLLLPSTSEGIANVVLEAMAVGLPVVSSDCGGMPEAIKHGINGYLFKSRNPEDMAKNIKLITELDPTKRHTLAIEAKKTVETFFTLKQLGNNIQKLYKTVLCA